MKTGRVASTTVVALAGLVWWATAAERTAQPAATGVVATVGTQNVTREDFERRAATGRAEFEKRRGERLNEEFQAILDRQILESMIRSNLLVLEARRTGVRVTDAEAEALLKSDPYFNPGGRFDAERYQAIKTKDPAGFKQALEKNRSEAAGRKLAEQLHRKHRPEEERVRLLAERALSTATVEHVIVPRFDFSGDYPEPTERAIVDHYRRHADQYRRPGRAVLTVIRVDLGEGARSHEAKQRADSALTAIRGGASLDRVGENLGQIHRDVMVVPGQFPAFWRGDQRVSESVFRTAAGTLLAQPVPGDRGSWLVVRVDHSEGAHVAPLREAAPAIRQELRTDARLHFEERELRALYESRRDSLKGPAYRIRYAAADTGRLDIGKPSAADLERFYRSHLADYTSYDAATAAIVVKPLAEVSAEIRQRWDVETRMLLAKEMAEGWIETWGRGARDRKLERSASLLREVGPVPAGAPADTGLAGRALSDTLFVRGMDLGVGILPYARGLIVYHIYEKVPDRIPTFDEVRRPLTERYRVQRMYENERLARQAFERNPERFATGNVLHLSRINIEPMDIVNVPLTRAEVERFHRDNIDRYSAPEQIRARHILISPVSDSPEADAAARAEAEQVLSRIRAGEDFGSLARRHSDDPPTRDRNGDLGFFSRGAMLEQFERTAFAMKPGEVSEPVKTEVGYHIIQLMEHQPMVAEPLVTLYSNVGSEAAAEKAQRLAQQRADSIYRVVRTPAAARALARKLGLEVVGYRHVLGSTAYPQHLRPVMARLEQVPMGTLYPGAISLKAQGAAVMWPDSISPPHAPSWQEARTAALEAYMHDAGKRAIEAKHIELDSLLASGWGIDSIANLWGGWTRVDPLKPGAKVRGLGGDGVLDSLVFGGKRAPALAPGEVSGWLDLPSGLALVRLVDRRGPSPAQLQARIESERRLGLERNMFLYYEDLKKRHAVRIVDARLREVTIPPPPPENAPF